jgi:hypothetical protein
MPHLMLNPSIFLSRLAVTFSSLEAFLIITSAKFSIIRWRLEVSHPLPDLTDRSHLTLRRAAVAVVTTD